MQVHDEEQAVTVGSAGANIPLSPSAHAACTQRKCNSAARPTTNINEWEIQEEVDHADAYTLRPDVQPDERENHFQTCYGCEQKIGDGRSCLYIVSVCLPALIFSPA